MIKFLLYRLNSIDGHKGSIDRLIFTMIKDKLKEKNTKTRIPNYTYQKVVSYVKWTNPELYGDLHKKALKKAFLKFKILRYRMKISFMAFI